MTPIASTSPLVATLANGIRIVASRQHSPVSYVGVAVNAGSRDDFQALPGVAHFVEHTIFKGTPTRKSRAVSSRMESIGGELNAYTTKEETLVYTNAPAGYVDRALDLLADLLENACFPAEEIDTERNVITEEIFSYRDNPVDAVYDEFDELIFRGSPLAHNILGTEQSVVEITSADARRFIETRYAPERMVVYIVDPDDPERNIRKAEHYFSRFPARKAEIFRQTPAPLAEAFCEKRDGDNHQNNNIIGTRLPGRTDSRRHALFLFNNWLGGPAMNSRLNQQLRERRGLVYSVDSSLALYSDAGEMQIYYGCEPKATDKCASLITREIHAAASSLMPEKTFEQVKRQYCGQLTVGYENRENRAMSLAKSLIYYNEVRGLEQMVEGAMGVTREQFRAAAELIASSPLCRLTLA